MINPYKLHNQLLSPVEHYKYLGVIIQRDLKLQLYTQSITSKANKIIGLLKCNLRTSSTNLRERAYLSLVHPKFEYATTIWKPYLTNDEITRLLWKRLKGVLRDMLKTYTPMMPV